MPRCVGRPEGHFDLELGDFKVHRKWRLMAIDHDLVSFVDVSQARETWPLILVTNPKVRTTILSRGARD